MRRQEESFLPNLFFYFSSFSLSLTSCSFSRIPVDFYDSDNDSPTHTQHDMRLDIIQHESHIATMASTFVSRTIEEKIFSRFFLLFPTLNRVKEYWDFFFWYISFSKFYMHLMIFALMKSRISRESKFFFGFSIRFFFGTSFFQPSRCVPQNKMA